MHYINLRLTYLTIKIGQYLPKLCSRRLQFFPSHSVVTSCEYVRPYACLSVCLYVVTVVLSGEK